ncbi:U3 snoRNP protein, partial [Kickxella alabastrina]
MRTCFATVPFTPAARGATPAGQQQQGAQGGALAMRQIHILSRVAEYATSQAADARALLDLLLPILRKPNAAVPERTKGHVLRMMLRFVPIVLAPEAAPPATLLSAYLDVVSACFGRLRLDSSRTTLAEIMQLLAGFGSAPALVAAAEIIRDINSLSQERLGGADFEVRLGGYARLNERLWAAPMLDSHAWVPLLHNLTFFAQDHEEMSIRSNAAYGLARFIARLASALRDDPLAAEPETRSLGRCLTAIVLPAIRHAFNSKYEIVREEYLGVLRRAVRECGAYFDELRDLMALDNKDEEINFFYNIVHVQIHRRLRALRRFRDLVNTKPIDQGAGAVDAESMDVDAEEEDSEDDAGSGSDNEEIADALAKKKPAAAVAQKPKADRSSLAPLNLASANNSSSETASPISQPNIRGLFMPLLEHWALAESAAEVNHELTHEAILTIGALGAILPWSQYSSAMRKYLAMMKKSPEMEKRLTRLVLALLDNFHYDLRQVKVDHMGRLLSKRDMVQ